MKREKVTTGGLAALLLLVFTGIVDVTRAEDLDWSFTNNPQPPFEDLTAAEKRVIKELEDHHENTEPNEYCVEVPRGYFQIYNARYPEFALKGSEEERYVIWKRHIIAQDASTTGQSYASPATCIALYLDIDLLRTMISIRNETLIYYCGQYSGDPVTEGEKKFFNQLNELIAYAKLGSADAMAGLLRSNSDGLPITLNPDVEYFFRRSLKKKNARDLEWDTSHLESFMTKERMNEVDAAVDNDDLEAILATTLACGIKIDL